MLLGYIIIIFPIIAVLSLIFISPLLIYNKIHQRRKPFIRYVVIYAFIGCCMSLCYLTILWYYPDITFHPAYHFLNLKPFVWINEVYDMGFNKMIQQLVLNIGMFVPYGLLLALAFKRLRNIYIHLPIVFLTTLFIETIQYFIGRSADIDDVIMNFLGGLIGFFIYKLMERIFRKKHWWDILINNEK